MSSDQFDYKHIYSGLRAHLITEGAQDTKEITASIKLFFCQKYNIDYKILCSGGTHSEYMVDVLVTSFNPKQIFQQKTLDLVPETFRTHLAVESELGGTGASSPYGVMKNVGEDFVKLLLVRADRRVMIMTSLPYAHEAEEHVERRVESLRQLYGHFPTLSSGVLVVHIEGGQPKSTQVQVKIGESTIRGFLIPENGKSVHEL
ncbi:hypothetical protein EJP67_10680 [Variovorax guangxiensis]|uniref:Uncharacterized protein n=1 Tax=Variovorax guangxiensis TaxID=1775474 RepID=A0A3S0XEI3_9BURK|nr:hypothetical protein [Variovorax guangxiensis]RUR67519.1 hypothetical protein EJP67_10680 [Variovorax guangxiensis]